jgi:hypothetical protein
MAKERKMTKEQTTISKHTHETKDQVTRKPGVNSGTPEELTVPVLLI